MTEKSTTKVPVSSLSGTALDWAVAVCEGVETDECHRGIWFEQSGLGAGRVPYSPSTEWAQGGPIIDREHIGHQKMEGEQVYQAWRGTCIEFATWPVGSSYAEGPTPLIAAMRCYVASKLGNDIEVPSILLKES